MLKVKCKVIMLLTVFVHPFQIKYSNSRIVYPAHPNIFSSWLPLFRDLTCALFLENKLNPHVRLHSELEWKCQKRMRHSHEEKQFYLECKMRTWKQQTGLSSHKFLNTCFHDLPFKWVLFAEAWVVAQPNIYCCVGNNTSVRVIVT